MVEGASPPGGVRGPAVLNGRPVRFRITPDKLEHLSITHRSHSSAVTLLADSPFKARLSEKLVISRMEIELLGRRFRSNDHTQQYRLEDIFESVRATLNSVREELLSAVHSAIGQEIAVPEPEALIEPLREPPPIPAPEAVKKLPEPVPVAVTPAGVAPTPRKPLLESEEYLVWQQSLKPEQALGLEFIEGLESGKLIERIFKTQELMIHKDIYGAALIDLVLDAVYKLRQRKIPGLSRLLDRLCEEDQRGFKREALEVRGAAVEIVRLGIIAEEETPNPLTEVGRIFKKIEFYPLRRLVGEAGVRYLPTNDKRQTEDAEADGYRGSSGTLIEIKYSSQPLTLNEGNGQVLRLLNQARKYQAAIRKGIIKFVTFIIIAPELDPELIKLIGGMVYGELFHFTDITSRSGQVHLLMNLKLMPGKLREVREPHADPSRSKWNEAAWIWGLQKKHTGEAGGFKGFDGDPLNLHKVVRQPQTRAMIRGLQARLDKAIQSAQQEKVHALTPAKKSEADAKIAKAQDLKKMIAGWRKNLDTNSLSTSTICDFSFVLQEVREFLG